MIDIKNLSCVIFAGGKSSRMGRDKALLKINGKSLTRYQYERLKPLFKKIYISTKEKKFDFKCDMILDSSPIYAPTPAFLDIFKILDQFFALSVDTPFVDKEVIEKIALAANQHPNTDAIIAKTTFPHPLIGIYKKSILPLLQNAIEKQNYKLNAILKKANTHYVEFEKEEKFFNCNYPEEFQEFLKKIC